MHKPYASFLLTMHIWKQAAHLTGELFWIMITANYHLLSSERIHKERIRSLSFAHISRVRTVADGTSSTCVVLVSVMPW